MKKCSSCKELKDELEFSKASRKNDGLQDRCKECNKKTNKEYYSKNKEAISKRKKKWVIKNKSEIREKQKIYYQNNKENKKKAVKEYRYKRYNSDPIFRLKSTVRSRMSNCLRNYEKSESTIEYLGCNINDYVLYLKSMFEDGMNMDNYGEWHIDHIIPLASAKNKEELIKLFHYTNTQPMWAKENLQKGCKLDYEKHF